MFVMYEWYNHADVGNYLNLTAKEMKANLSLGSCQITEVSW